MTKSRLEAFSDGVIAIIITIMVLELKVPAGKDWSNLAPLAAIGLSYLLSFVFVGIYWNNHHHLFQATKNVNGKIMWANLHLLFWLSLIPFGTAWMGEHAFQGAPVALYGVLLLGAALAFWLLARTLVDHHGPESAIAAAIGNGKKEKLSLGLYATAVAVSWFATYVSCALYVVVAIIWLVPDKRIERVLGD
jgi:uncharacterized membrane protein